ncbi:MAG: hypothetical protein SNI57_06550 [Rikenellaceae bacterium]
MILPAAPSFYTKASTIEELAQTVSARAARMAGVECRVTEWQGK